MMCRNIAEHRRNCLISSPRIMNRYDIEYFSTSPTESVVEGDEGRVWTMGMARPNHKH